MAKKNKRKKAREIIEDDFDEPRPRSIKEETMRIIYAILLFLAAVFLIFSALHKAGVGGESVFGGLGSLFGAGYYLLPVIFAALGVLFIKSISTRTVAWPKLVGAGLFMIASLGILSILIKNDTGYGEGGMIGNVIAAPLLSLFDFWVTLVFLVGIVVISLILILESHLTWSSLMFWKKDEGELEDISDEEADTVEVPEAKAKPEPEPAKPEPKEEEEEEDVQIALPEESKKGKKDVFTASLNKLLGKPFTPPPLDLLEGDRGKPGVGDIKANANIIKRTLQNFGINVEMDEISIGPSVTRYALKPAEGVKLARIVGLQNDLSLALAAHPIRIEAPIPGKSLVGIELPNTAKTTVGLGSLLSSDEFRSSDKPLLFAIGKGVSGKSHFANLAKMPHLLVAGATGSGKSVTIHAILTSLLYRNSPENLKFIMIDPKRVELTQYNNIPHLLTPVITEGKKAILALKWAAKEMDRRYDILETEKVRDIESYHKNILAPALKKLEGKGDEEIEASERPEMMPYIVIIIDELADLMQAYPRELESAIVRLAQMSRAVGIHLIVSTQRPSVNVITGLIKANIPSRIALQVTSQVDSRTILDSGGAEKLLGAGDMLFISGDMAKPVRVQSAFISESEMKSVVKYLIDNYADAIPSDINLSDATQDNNSIFDATMDGDGEEDDLYEEARDVVVQAGKASTSYLQRKLRIGYARAARLIDMLEERGVIGPGEGAKPREVLGGGAAASSSDGDFDQES